MIYRDIIIDITMLLSVDIVWYSDIPWLVGGLEHEFYGFPYIGNKKS